MQAGLRGGSFSEDRPLGWDPAAAGNRAGDGMARFASEEKAAGVSAQQVTNTKYTTVYHDFCLWKIVCDYVMIRINKFPVKMWNVRKVKPCVKVES